VAAVLENPAGSMLWTVPNVAKLCQHRASTQVVLDYCQFGAVFRKRTRLQGWHLGGLSELRHLCTGRGGLCSRTCRPHQILEGAKMTKTAAAYPPQFALQAAHVLFSSVNNSSVERMWKIIHPD